MTFLTGFTYVSLVILIPEQLQIVYSDTPVLAGTHLLAMLGTCALGSILSGLFCKKWNYTSHILMVGSVLQMCGTGAVFAYTGTESNIKAVIGYTAVYGLGVGLCFAAATIITSVEARHDDLAVAQGVLAQARVLGGAIGLAVCTIIFNTQVEGDLAGYAGVTTDQHASIHRSPIAMLKLNDPDLRARMLASYLAAFRKQMLVMLLVCFAAGLASIATHQLNPPPVVDRIAQHKEFPARGSITELETLGSVRSRHQPDDEEQHQSHRA